MQRFRGCSPDIPRRSPDAPEHTDVYLSHPAPQVMQYNPFENEDHTVLSQGAADDRVDNRCPFAAFDRPFPSEFMCSFADDGMLRVVQQLEWVDYCGELRGAGAHFLHFVPKFPSVYICKWVWFLVNEMHKIDRRRE